MSRDEAESLGHILAPNDSKIALGIACALLASVAEERDQIVEEIREWRLCEEHPCGHEVCALIDRMVRAIGKKNGVRR